MVLDDGKGFDKNIVHKVTNPYFTEEDIDYLLKRINLTSPFPLERDYILVGVHGQYTPAIGAALFYVEQFLQSV